MLERGGDRDGARADYEMMKRRDPLSVHPYQCISRQHANMGNTEEEIEELYRALQINPDAECIEVVRLLCGWRVAFGKFILLQRLCLAEALCKQGRFEHAAGMYDAVLRHYPHAMQPLTARGHIAIRLGRLREAAGCLRAACDGCAPGHVDSTAANNLGCVLFCLGDFEGAIASFSSRIAADPSDFKCIMNRGHAYMKHGQVELAVRDYTTLSLQYPNTATVLLLLQLARESPTELCRELTVYRLVFSRRLTVETWLNKPGPFIAASTEYFGFGAEDMLGGSDEQEDSDYVSEGEAEEVAAAAGDDDDGGMGASQSSDDD